MKKYTKIINESLIKSYPIRFLEKRIKKIFSDIEILINEDYMILNFYHNITKLQYDNLLKELKLSGYFISYITTDNIFNSNKFTIQIDKKYPENNLYTGFIYHITSYKKINKIIDNGIIPKSENNIINYPDRIYFFKENINKQKIINLLNKLYDIKPEKYIIIKTYVEDLKSYKDLDSNGYYTYDNIKLNKYKIYDENFKLLQINESVKINKILYHGSPHLFEKFKNISTFFSETIDFARNYGDTKSFDFGMDADITVYECQVNADIFDINNKKDYNFIKNVLPDEINYSYNNFGFKKSVKKDEFLMYLTGYYYEKPMKDINNKKIGDKIEVKISMSQSEYYTIYKIDDNYVYAYSDKEYNYIINKIFSSYEDIHFNRELIDIFKPLKKFTWNYIKSYTKNYISDSLLKIYGYSFIENRDVYGYNIKLNPDAVEEFHKIYDKMVKELIEKLKEIYSKKFIKKQVKREFIDTWRFYENQTMHDILVKNFDGYVAKEKNVNTYCIFNPDNHVKIIKFYINDREFDSYKEWKNYNKFNNEIYKKK